MNQPVVLLQGQSRCEDHSAVEVNRMRSRIEMLEERLVRRKLLGAGWTGSRCDDGAGVEMLSSTDCEVGRRGEESGRVRKRGMRKDGRRLDASSKLTETPVSGDPGLDGTGS